MRKKSQEEYEYNGVTILYQQSCKVSGYSGYSISKEKISSVLQSNQVCHFFYTSIIYKLQLTYIPGVAILKKISWFVKEVIIFYKYILVVFTPYYDPSPPLWKVVVNSMSSFLYYCHNQKGCIFVAVCSLL